MPSRDKTGPEGKGPKSGRGLGDCKPDSGIPKSEESYQRRYPNPRPGRGQGQGRVRGFFGRWFNK